MATNDPDHHDVFPGGKAGTLVRRETVTQTEIDSLLEAAGLPTSTTPVDETHTVPAPPLGTGLEPYEELLGDRGGYIRAPLTLLTLALW